MWVLRQLRCPVFVGRAVLAGLSVLSWGKSEGFLLSLELLRAILEDPKGLHKWHFPMIIMRHSVIYFCLFKALSCLLLSLDLSLSATFPTPVPIVTSLGCLCVCAEWRMCSLTPDGCFHIHLLHEESFTLNLRRIWVMMVNYGVIGDLGIFSVGDIFYPVFQKFFYPNFWNEQQHIHSFWIFKRTRCHFRNIIYESPYFLNVLEGII